MSEVALRELRELCGAQHVLPGDSGPYLHDATEHAGLRGRALAVALPGDEAELAAVLAWSDRHDVAVVPRGGGTGFAGGCVPLDGELVLSTERLAGAPAIEPELWRMRAPAGATTAHVHRVARESGLLFPPDPGAAEQSLIGGNVATNAGGPHAFKYGVTGHWVSGIRAALPSGELIEVGGPLRKDVAGYDLRGLLIGSEGTLAVISSVWLRLLPAPEQAIVLAAAYPDTAAGCAALGAVLAAGLVPAALEYVDAGTLDAVRAGFPDSLPGKGRFLVLAEADGSREEAERNAAELAEALAPGSAWLGRFASRAEREGLWRWRDGVSLGVAARRGGKLSEDVAVPFERLGEAIEATVEIGRRHGLEACSWGHAGDANLHSTLLIDASDQAERERAAAAAEELFALALRLGGTVTGEHGIGWVKRGQLEHQLGAAALALHRAVKRAFDPKGLLNPGKKA